jgi:hypothetical protein
MRRLATVAFVLVTLCPCRPANALDFLVLHEDAAGEGYFDPVFGAARRAAFEYAAGVWGGLLDGPVPVVVRTRMDPLGGSATAAVLGYAGPTVVWRDSPNVPREDMWYVSALANQFAGVDLDPASPDILVVLNSDLDGDVLGVRDWYYGTDRLPGVHVDFVAVALHELGHGLGFTSLINKSTGLFLWDSPDIYSFFLELGGGGPLVSLPVEERLAAMTSDNVWWWGGMVQAAHGGPARIFAPDPVQGGSSISHWDVSHSPHELMEPYYGGAFHDPGLALDAFHDMGWGGLTDWPLLPPQDLEVSFE